MEIRHNQNLKKYSAYKDFEEIGFITYSTASDELIILDHTEVMPAYSGQGVGKEILNYIIKEARENQFKIIPLCPFTKHVFDHDKSLSDVLRGA